ncbi:MAG: hypothetical protein ACYDEX_15250 [Mobilitalea sp.]
MNIEQQLLYLNKNYKILSTEQEFIVHPAAFGLLPLVPASLQYSFNSFFHIEDYRLILDKIIILNGEISGLGGMKTDANENSFLFQNTNVTYNGSILIGAKLVKEYNIKGNRMNCFSFQSVFELVFEDGILITTIDQSKAMSRIRKNIELGLRSLSKSRDVRLIQHFINSSLVGDYKPFRRNNSRLKYLNEMKNFYTSTSLLKQINIINKAN